MTDPPGIRGPLADLYDVFVDWPGRLGRELPGLEAHLRAAGARRVLDVGCGTGQHVAALTERGYEVHGADASEDMLARARSVVDPARLHAWRLGEPPGEELLAAGPFDAVLALGNVWPQVLEEADARAAAAGFVRLLRPGGLVLLGLKAFAVRAAAGNPYLPLLRREHAGRPLWFVRFVDFDEPPLPDGTRVAGFHMLVAGAEEGQALHRAGRVRVWAPDELGGWWRDRGLEGVRVSGRLDDPEAPARTEDVFLSGRAPS